MNRFACFLPALALTLAFSLLSVASGEETQIYTNLPAVAGPPNVETPFPIGETIHFKIYWGFIEVAKSTADTRWVEIKGKKYIAIRFRTQSTAAILNKVYPVNDFIESIVDPATLTPIQFVKVLNEGKYHCREHTTFDQTKKMARWVSVNRKKKKDYAIDENTRDLATFMYMVRSQKFKPNTKYAFSVMADERIYDLDIVTGKNKNIKTGTYGKVDSIRLNPEAAFEGLFVRKGKMVIYVSNDDRQVLTLMDVDTPFANVHIRLHKITGGPHDKYNPKKVEVDLDKELKR